jgi:hypothetical protein
VRLVQADTVHRADSEIWTANAYPVSPGASPRARRSRHVHAKVAGNERTDRSGSRAAMTVTVADGVAAKVQGKVITLLDARAATGCFGPVKPPGSLGLVS